MQLSVLLIEHDAALIEQVSRGLRNAGFVVMALRDADESIDLLRMVSFDLVLADVGTLRYAAGGGTGLTALMQVLRHAPLMRFTTPATMGRDGACGALVLDPPTSDLPHLLAAINRLCPAPGTAIAV